MIVANTRLQQHTVFNCYDTYSDDLELKVDGVTHGGNSEDYLASLRHFESLYSRYKRRLNRNLNDVFLKVKY